MEARKDTNSLYQELETREAAPLTVLTTNISLKRKMRTDRTTRLLIVILCLFLISEFPQVPSTSPLLVRPRRLLYTKSNCLYLRSTHSTIFY